MKRVLVGGISGAGKTTFARRLADRLALPYHEMDSFYHGPNWQPIPSFVADVEAVAEQPAWVFDSPGYKQVREIVWSLADTVVWLDYRRATVVRRVVSRSSRRALTGEPIFNGNTETFAAWLDPGHPVQWAVRAYRLHRELMWRDFSDPRYAHIRRVRITRPEATEAWLDAVAPCQT